jgi:hypothetical protein
MSPLARRSSRLVWAWCVAYTTVATPPARERRRGEIRSHLWESEHLLLPAVAVVLAGLRGVLHDLGWALASGVPRLGRSLGTPTPYIVIAPLCPVEGWIVSGLAVGRVAHIGEFVGATGGGSMLALAAAAWLLQRRRG